MFVVFVTIEQINYRNFPENFKYYNLAFSTKIYLARNERKGLHCFDKYGA